MVFVHPPMLRLAPLVAIADGSAGAFATGHIQEAAISTEREVFHAVVHADAPENKIGKASKTLSQKLRGYQYRCLRYKHPSKPYDFMRFGAMDVTKPKITLAGTITL